MPAYMHTPPTTSLTEMHYGIHVINLDVYYTLPNPEGFYLTIEASTNSKQWNVYSEYMTHATQQYRT